MRMIEQAAHQRPRLPAITGFEKCRWIDAAIKSRGLIRPAERDLPDVLQGNTGVCRKSNTGLLRIRPAPAKVLARTQQSAPKTLRRCPDAVLPATAVVNHRVDRVTVEIRTTHFPAGAIGVGTKDKSSFRCSYQQEKISFADSRVTHTVQDRGSRFAAVGARRRCENGRGLDGLERR